MLLTACSKHVDNLTQAVWRRLVDMQTCYTMCVFRCVGSSCHLLVQERVYLQKSELLEVVYSTRYRQDRTRSARRLAHARTRIQTRVEIHAWYRTGTACSTFASPSRARGEQVGHIPWTAPAVPRSGFPSQLVSPQGLCFAPKSIA